MATIGIGIMYDQIVNRTNNAYFAQKVCQLCIQGSGVRAGVNILMDTPPDSSMNAFLTFF